MAQILSIQHKTTIGKYLGIHNIVFWKDPINTNDLILKMQKKLAGWKANTLSRGGRLTLIKANLTGMPNHVLSCFKCPQKITSRLDRECWNFFWGNDMKSPPITWSAVCTPKHKGGLGVRPSAWFNNAALAKLGWKLLTDPNNWWVRIMSAKYLRNKSFFTVKKSSQASLAWKGILDSRELLKEGMRWIVGNGQQINFWLFNWVYPFPLINFLNENDRLRIDSNDLVSDYLSNNVWNSEKLLQFLPPQVVYKITSIPLPLHNVEDEFIWGPAGNGRFSINSASELQAQKTIAHSKSKLLSLMWKLPMPPKVKIFSWQLIRNRLRSKDN